MLKSLANSVLTDHNYFPWVSNIFIFVTEFFFFCSDQSAWWCLKLLIVILSCLNKGSFLKLPFCGNASKFNWLFKKLLIKCNTNLLLFTNLFNLLSVIQNCYLLRDQYCKKFWATLFQNNAFKVYSIVGLRNYEINAVPICGISQIYITNTHLLSYKIVISYSNSFFKKDFVFLKFLCLLCLKVPQQAH